MIKIAETHEEKRENILHWERMRMMAQKSGTNMTGHPKTPITRNSY